jgi:hypothetical protein
MSDSVSIDHVPGDDPTSKTSALSIKAVIIVFLVFLVMSSDVFASEILSGFAGTTRPLSSEITNWGVVVSGIFAVIAYVGIIWLSDCGIL